MDGTVSKLSGNNFTAKSTKWYIKRYAESARHARCTRFSRKKPKGWNIFPPWLHGKYQLCLQRASPRTLSLMIPQQRAAIAALLKSMRGFQLAGGGTFSIISGTHIPLGQEFSRIPDENFPKADPSAATIDNINEIYSSREYAKDLCESHYDSACYTERETASQEICSDFQPSDIEIEHTCEPAQQEPMANLVTSDAFEVKHRITKSFRDGYFSFVKCTQDKPACNDGHSIYLENALNVAKYSSRNVEDAKLIKDKFQAPGFSIPLYWYFNPATKRLIILVASPSYSLFLRFSFCISWRSTGIRLGRGNCRFKYVDAIAMVRYVLDWMPTYGSNLPGILEKLLLKCSPRTSKIQNTFWVYSSAAPTKLKAPYPLPMENNNAVLEIPNESSSDNISLPNCLEDKSKWLFYGRGNLHDLAKLPAKRKKIILPNNLKVFHFSDSSTLIRFLESSVCKCLINFQLHDLKAFLANKDIDWIEMTKLYVQVNSCFRGWVPYFFIFHRKIGTGRDDCYLGGFRLIVNYGCNTDSLMFQELPLSKDIHRGSYFRDEYSFSHESRSLFLPNETREERSSAAISDFFRDSFYRSAVDERPKVNLEHPITKSPCLTYGSSTQRILSHFRNLNYIPAWNTSPRHESLKMKAGIPLNTESHLATTMSEELLTSRFQTSLTEFFEENVALVALMHKNVRKIVLHAIPSSKERLVFFSPKKLLINFIIKD